VRDKKMEAKVNQDKCIACGMCIASLNDVFDYNDEGLAHVITDNIDKDLEDEVRDVADGCPVGAIEIK
jgi:ferredoxin